MNDHELHNHLIDRQGSRRDLNSPVLVLELDALTRNIARMAEFCVRSGVKIRPHAKTHKSAEIAKRQLAAGAIGICCAKLGEAEALADEGVTAGLLITSPVVSAPAISRLMMLNARADGLMCVVDNPLNVEALGHAAHRSGHELKVLIDVDPGFRRTGVASAEDAVELFHVIARQSALTMAGVQFYCGQQQHIESFDERKRVIEERTDYARGIVAALTAAGAKLELITGGGTGTHRIDAALGFLTELQVGSYIFMDSDYAACDLTGDGGLSPFEAALVVDTRVISTNNPGMVTLDAGVKAFSTDAGIPKVSTGAPTEVRYMFMGDEHGALLLNGACQPALGDTVTLITPHCDPTVNLYDTYHVVQGDTLRALWPIAGRGRSR